MIQTVAYRQKTLIFRTLLDFSLSRVCEVLPSWKNAKGIYTTGFETEVCDACGVLTKIIGATRFLSLTELL